MKVDFVIGTQYGDEGKGKITHHLCRQGSYTHVLRFNGGCNAGHTIYHNGKKFVTHHIPSGVFFGIRSIIGNGCVLDPDQFKSEIKYLEENGISTKGLIFVAENTHVILSEHKEEDSSDTAIGTTKRGNGPAYRNKYNRSGLTVAQYAKDNEWIRPFIIDIYKEFHESETSPYILCEGAQGFGIDIDWGDYPYVTSSHCTTAGALLNGIPPQSANQVWGGAKCYETYVGSKDFYGKERFEGERDIFEKIQSIGQEFGATTGRPRQVNWLNLDFLKKSININGITHLVMNKVDILEKVDSWTLILNDQVIKLKDKMAFESLVADELMNMCPTMCEVYFSDSPHKI